MSDGSFDYKALVQDSLRGVVVKVLKQVEESGLPGNHHFYIAFQTNHPGVILPEHLGTRYPREMTIVIQHQFWDLKVHEDRFEVSLSFNQKPSHMVIPFAALTGFLDPAVEFGLQFRTEGERRPGEAREPSKPTGQDGQQGTGISNPVQFGGQASDVANSTDEKPPARSRDMPAWVKHGALFNRGGDEDPASGKAEKPSKDKATDKEDAEKRGEVVSLDSFRGPTDKKPAGETPPEKSDD